MADKNVNKEHFHTKNTKCMEIHEQLINYAMPCNVMHKDNGFYVKMVVIY